jgi:hypothetical protein
MQIGDYFRGVHIGKMTDILYMITAERDEDFVCKKVSPIDMYETVCVLNKKDVDKVTKVSNIKVILLSSKQ